MIQSLMRHWSPLWNSIQVARKLLVSLERSSSSLADLDRRSSHEEEAPDHRRWHQLLHRVHPLGSSDGQLEDRQGQ